MTLPARAMRAVDALVAAVAGLAMVAMMLQVSLDVICKYLLNWPVPLTQEAVSSCYMVMLVFLPLGLVTRAREHVAVELFTQRLDAHRLSLFQAFGGLVSIAYVGAIAWFTTVEAIHKTEIRENWETVVGYVDVWPARWIVPVGCLVMLAWLVVHLVDDIAFFRSGARERPAAASGDADR